LAEQKIEPNERTPTSQPPSSSTILPLKDSESATWDVWYKTKGVVSGPSAPSLTSEDYPRLNLPNPFGESRLIIWMLAQQHVYWGSFVLGILLLTTYFEIKGLVAQNIGYNNLVYKMIRLIILVLSITEILSGIFLFSPSSFLAGIVLLAIYWEPKGQKEQNTRYDKLAYEMLRLTILAVSITAVLGGIFLFSLFSLYPDFTKYLLGVFQPVFLLYGFLALVLTALAYLYYSTWSAMTKGRSKWLHISLGVVVNVIGITLMLSANAWSSHDGSSRSRFVRSFSWKL
jgi:hypothetical protein